MKFLIIGLGNPDSSYAQTYHNVGLLLLDALHIKLPAPPWKKRRTFQYGQTDMVILAKSNVCMNDSGRAVADALSFFKLPADNLIVVHDDADILLGHAKYSFDRGAAGHNGVSSVIATLGTTAFGRLRIGTRIAKADIPHRQSAGTFALRQIDPEARTAYFVLFDRIIDVLIEKMTPSSDGRSVLNGSETF